MRKQSTIRGAPKITILLVAIAIMAFASVAFAHTVDADPAVAVKGNTMITQNSPADASPIKANTMLTRKDGGMTGIVASTKDGGMGGIEASFYDKGAVTNALADPGSRKYIKANTEKTLIEPRNGHTKGGHGALSPYFVTGLA